MGHRAEVALPLGYLLVLVGRGSAWAGKARAWQCLQQGCSWQTLSMPTLCPGSGGSWGPCTAPRGAQHAAGWEQWAQSEHPAMLAFPSSGSWVLISLWLPGRGREVALEWGGLAQASIFNELDIYFSPSWLPPHRSLCLLPPRASSSTAVGSSRTSTPGSGTPMPPQILLLED